MLQVLRSCSPFGLGSDVMQVPAALVHPHDEMQRLSICQEAEDCRQCADGMTSFMHPCVLAKP